MSFEESLKCISVPASKDLSEFQYRIMLMTTADTLVEADAATAVTIGVLQDKPDAAGRVGSVAISGISKVEAGGTVTVGDEVMAGTDGVAIVATAGSYVSGIAMSSAVTGDIFPISVMSYQKNA
jgi:hypothetical protein